MVENRCDINIKCPYAKTIKNGIGKWLGIGMALALLVCPLAAQARLFFVGSNPIYSIIAYPQDLANSYYDRTMLSYSLSYQSLPWWGNVNNAMAKPNDTYTATEQDITVDEDAWFTQKGDRQVMENKIEFLQPWLPGVRSLFTFYYVPQWMANKAEGNLSYDDPDYGEGYVPFSYEMSESVSTVGGQVITSFPVLGLPAGVKLAFERENPATVQSQLEATVDGQTIESDRFLWGWATTPCNHIFDREHINGDAWYLDSYTMGAKSKFDAQIGITLPTVKVGNRFRYSSSSLDQYAWVAVDQPANTLEANFLGSYVQSDWFQVNSAITERLYANVTWQRTSTYSFNTLIFLGMDSAQTIYEYRADRSIDDGTESNTLGGVLEINPNINIYLTPLITIDAALLAEVSLSRNENTYERWNAQAGGTQTRFRNSTVYVGPEYAWERYSYADENFFDFGAEVDFIMSFFKDEKSELTLLPDLMFNSKITHVTKTFGQNSDDGFSTDAYRANFKREFWFNASLSVLYRYKPWNVRLDIIEPLLYAREMETQVLDENREVLYNSRQVSQWAVQDGLRLALWIGYEF